MINLRLSLTKDSKVSLMTKIKLRKIKQTKISSLVKKSYLRRRIRIRRAITTRVRNMIRIRRDIQMLL